MTTITNQWQWQKQINLSSGSALTNYQLKFTVNRSEGVDSGYTVYVGTKCQDDYDDIRFANSAGTILDYWIESSSSSTATIWVEVDSIANGTTTIYLFYGNPDATAISDGSTTFIFFDDFLGTTLDGTKWTDDHRTGTLTIGSSIMTITAVDNDYPSIYTNSSLCKTNTGTRARLKSGHVATTPYWERVVLKNVSPYSEVAAEFSNQGSAIKDYYCYDGTHGTATMPTWAANTYAIMELLLYSDHLVGTVNDTDSTTVSSHYTTTDKYINPIVSRNGATLSIDWILIRQITASPPTITAWGSENDRSGIGFGTVDMMMV